MATYDATLAYADADALQLRIGVDPIERLEWALRFAETDDTQLTAADRDIERWQLALFAGTPIFWWDRLPTNYQLLREKFGHCRRIGAWKMPVPDDELVGSVRKKFQQILSTLRGEGFYAIKLNVSYVIQLGDPTQFREPKDFHPPLYFDEDLDKLSRGMLVRAGELGDEAKFKFAELLAGHHGALRICGEPKCQRWFVSRNSLQTYCGPACQSRATSRALRERKAAKKAQKAKLK